MAGQVSTIPSAPSGQKSEFITAWFTPLLR